ncbi:chorismate mutase 1, chloroplastic-like isoform X2 [Apium graveolens]|uniref:chorismate mutase 1, chloroplastic-like isoform X2 n=1 Tax=Apium graveolens TaxID=4045 RepID=UPI003D7A4CD1
MEAKLLRVASPAIISTNYSTLSKPSSTFSGQVFQNCSFRCINLRHFKNFSFQPVQASAASIGSDAKRRIDESDSYTLDGIRSSLIRQEDSIIFSLVERAQYCYNSDTYDPNAFWKDGCQGSLVEFMLRGTETLHAQAGRYKSPDEHPFFAEHLPEPVLPPLQYPQVLHPVTESININSRIWDMYFRNLVPRLVKEGEDGNYGATAVCDTICLQALSKRIHYGKFVAEAKFRASPDAYETAIKEQGPANGLANVPRSRRSDH